MGDHILDWFAGSFSQLWWLWLALFIIAFFVFHYLRGILFKKARIRRIDRMSGEEFERYLALKYKDMGYHVRQTAKTGDFGADLILTDKRKKEKIVVQAKRYSGNVGVEAVQQVSAARLHYGADTAFVVTNSYFTKGAETLAATNDIRLFDREWIEELAKRRVPKKDLDSDTIDEAETLEIRFERTVVPPDGRPATKESTERMIEEYLIDQGYMLIYGEERGSEAV